MSGEPPLRADATTQTAAEPQTSVVERAESAAPAVSFDELAWAHFMYGQEQRDRGVLGGQWEAEFRRRLATFEASEGSVVRAFWGTHTPVGVALTARQPLGLGASLGLRASPRYTLHRSTGAIALPAELEAALFDGDLLAVKASGVLLGGSRRVILERVMGAEVYLVSLVDTSGGDVAPPAQSKRRATSREGDEP